MRDGSGSRGCSMGFGAEAAMLLQRRQHPGTLAVPLPADSHSVDSGVQTCSLDC